MENLLAKDIEEIVQRASEMAPLFKKDDLKTHQLRTFYGSVSRIRNAAAGEKQGEKLTKVKKDLVMLKPKLAYAAGRQPKSVRKFADFMIPRIEEVQDDQTLENFFLLVESIVAYHKFYGGD